MRISIKASSIDVIRTIRTLEETQKSIKKYNDSRTDLEDGGRFSQASERFHEIERLLEEIQTIYDFGPYKDE